MLLDLPLVINQSYSEEYEKVQNFIEIHLIVIKWWTDQSTATANLNHF